MRLADFRSWVDTKGECHEVEGDRKPSFFMKAKHLKLVE